jgi:hypothetical protein
MYGRTLLLSGAIGCGSLTGGEYYGESLLRLQGDVIITADQADYGDLPIAVSVLWTTGLGDGQPQAAVVATEFPARYTVDFFRPPESSDRLSIMNEPSVLAVIGLPVLFQDGDHDGVWDPDDGEEVIGGSFDTYVIYSESMPDWFTQQVGERYTTGYATVRLGDRNPCTEADRFGLVVPEGEFSDLFVGTLTPALRDWDCDGVDDEWSTDGWVNSGACPPADVITRECNELQHNLDEADHPADYERLRGILLEDRTWTECLREECPETIGGIEQG